MTDKRTLAEKFLEKNDAIRAPERGDWGLLCYGDGPPSVCGAGAPWFIWFHNPRDMVTYLTEHLVYSYPALSDIDLEAAAEGVRSIIHGQWCNGLTTNAETCNALNSLLAGHVQVQWMGSYELLAYGHGPKEAEIVETFLKEQDLKEIWVDFFAEENVELEKAFRKQLAEWGL